MARKQPPAKPAPPRYSMAIHDRETGVTRLYQVGSARFKSTRGNIDLQNGDDVLLLRTSLIGELAESELPPLVFKWGGECDCAGKSVRLGILQRLARLVRRTEPKE